MIRKILLTIVGLVFLLLLGITTLYFAASGDYELPPTTDQDPSLPSVTLDGVTFHAETFGKSRSPVVIILHGGPGNDYRYLLDLKALSDKYFVVFYDQRGTGLSPRVSEDQLTLANMIDDVDRIVRHYGKGNPVRLIGHSWGAMLASGYVAQHPDMVSHMILAEPGMLTTEAAQAFMEKFKMSFGWDGIKQLAWLWLQSRHVDKVDNQARDDYFFTHMMRLDAAGSPIAGYFCDGRPPEGLMKAWRYNFASNRKIQAEGVSDLENNPIDLVNGLKKYEGKTLFITGECNTMIGESFQRKFHLNYFPGAAFKVIPGSGHMMFSEKPSESLKVVETFLKK